MQGKVYLVGAGPGDPELITEKGLKLVASADVILYDRLIPSPILNRAKPTAELIYVGKEARCCSPAQSEVSQIMITKAKQGKTVVRLKGGDPFIFGRGGEEAEALSQAGIPFEVVPGVSSAIAVPAYAGIPLTHRHLASSVVIVTGHESPQKSRSRINWSALSRADTMVVLMGMENLGLITAELIKAGRSPQTPAAVIYSGTLSCQQTVVGTLRDIELKVKDAHLPPPAVVVIGEVMNLRGKLAWFKTKPLMGKRVLVPRATHQAGKLSSLLSQEGAEVVELPAIAIHPLPHNLQPLLSHLPTFNWLIFTSPNGVETFFSWLISQGKDARYLQGIKIGSIGPGTAKALQNYGIIPDIVPREYSTEGLIEELKKRLSPVKRFSFPEPTWLMTGYPKNSSNRGLRLYK